MSKKLKNVNAVKQLLDGSHKFQTKSKIALGNEKEYENHKVGDTWEEKNSKTGVVYIIEQKEGFTVRKLKNSGLFKKIREDLNTFSNCPKEKCTCLKPQRIDEKMRRIHGMCFDCVIDMEHQMKQDGTFDEYSKNMIEKNARAWLKQAEEDVKLLKRVYTESREIVKDEYGKMEHLDAKMTVEEFEEKIEKEFEKYKKTFLENLEKDNDKR